MYDAEHELMSVISRVAAGKERIVLADRGIAVIPAEDLAILEAIEDRLDIDEAERALADPANRQRVAWESVKADLGL
ncbi:MAG: prevent-host-death family protein [Chloroflexota bacterium]